MFNGHRRKRLVAVMAALALSVAACGENGVGNGNGNGNGEGILDEFDLSGMTISVGSKDFDEQILLGHILKEAFEYMGATVDDNIDLGGTAPSRQALLRGDIDTYMEYNGTGWVEHLGNDDPSSDPDTLTQNVHDADLEQNSIHWLGRAPFNNTYGFASSPELTASDGPFDMQDMADYLADNPDAVVCMEPEFPVRDDGLVLFETATGFEIPDSQIDIMDSGFIYTETADGSCDFGEIFTTDGRIVPLELGLVDDPGIMIIYNISMNLRDDKYQENPEAFDAIADALLNPLSQELMAQLNTLVSFDDEPAAVVAREYLITEGLIDGEPQGLLD